MDESLSETIKLTGSNYPMWKSKMRDKLICKDLWLPVLHGTREPENIDALTWEATHIKTKTYIRCFINMSLYNNFGDETKSNELQRKIGSMFQNKNALNRDFVFRKLVRLRYQDGSSMLEHLNTFQGLISQIVSLDMYLYQIGC